MLLHPEYGVLHLIGNEYSVLRTPYKIQIINVSRLPVVALVGLSNCDGPGSAVGDPPLEFNSGRLLPLGARLGISTAHSGQRWRCHHKTAELEPELACSLRRSYHRAELWTLESARHHAAIVNHLVCQPSAPLTQSTNTEYSLPTSSFGNHYIVIVISTVFYNVTPY